MIENFIAIGQSLAKFQLIESFLKIILVKNQIDQDKINKNLKKCYSVDELIDIPYGLLLKRYKKIFNNQSLCDRLLILKDYRNYLAHQAFIAGSSFSAETKQLVGINPIIIDYVELNIELDECIGLMTQEYYSYVRSH